MTYEILFLFGLIFNFYVLWKFYTQVKILTVQNQILYLENIGLRKKINDNTKETKD